MFVIDLNNSFKLYVFCQALDEVGPTYGFTSVDENREGAFALAHALHEAQVIFMNVVFATL